MRLGPVVGLAVFFGVVGACVETPTDQSPASPSTTVEVSTTMEVTVAATYAEPADISTTTEALSAQSIIIPNDDNPIEEIDCDNAEHLCETGAYNCDDLADFCDYGPDGGQDLPDDFEWDE
ncbi:MAG: hypothetical protein WCG49_08865 [Actinomycetes bacterium]